MSAERLDQIEDEMENIKQILGVAARMAERNSQSIDRLTDRLDRLTSTVDRLAVSQLNTEETMNRFIQNAEADRALMRGIQTENQRILQYLFGEQGTSET